MADDKPVGQDPQFSEEDIRAHWERQQDYEAAQEVGGEPRGAADTAYWDRRANGHDPRLRPLIVKTSGDFVRGFVPPDYVVDGVLQRGFLYSLTGATGAGKTAIALRLAACVALGRTFGSCDVEQGRVLVLAGENPDDVRMRWIAMAEQMGFDADDIEVQFIENVFSLRSSRDQIRFIAESGGGFGLVIVDTSPAFFEGDDENSNKELGDHARTLRTLTHLQGRPCVVATCHPVKNAAADNLAPRGGGAFVNEVDGNLTAQRTDAMVEMHWQIKFRGADFAAINFELLKVTSPKLVTAKGKRMPTIIVKALSVAEASAKADTADSDGRKLLSAMADHPGASMAKLAEELGWKLADLSPNKARVQRLLPDLRKDKLVTKVLNTWRLTSAGEKAAKPV